MTRDFILHVCIQKKFVAFPFVDTFSNFALKKLIDNYIFSIIC